MLQITIPARVREDYDEENNVFIYVTVSKEQTLQLEHSLVSLRKWEAKWRKPFLTKTEKTREEILDYVKCMTLTQNVKPEIYNYLTDENYNDIQEYIASPMTATTFSEDKNGKKNREVITAEVIYYWMIALTIPFECQRWHLNQLLTLIRVCNAKNKTPKKKSGAELLRNNAALNAARRRQHNSKG